MKKIVFLLSVSIVICDECSAQQSKYDFLPRDVVIFEDNQTMENPGTSPSKWKQGPLELKVIMEAQKNTGETICKVEKDGNDTILSVTQGHVWEVYCMEPKEKILLPDSFTLEYDFLFPANGKAIGNFTAVAFFREENGATRKLAGYTFWNSTPDKSPTPISNFGFSGGDESATESIAEDVVAVGDSWFPVHYLPSPPSVYPWQLPYGKWHHFALSYRHREVRGYINNYLLFTVPDCRFTPETFAIGTQPPVKYRNFRLATGKKMNPLNRILTENKFITHAINFDINKATITPESDPFIRQLADFLKANPKISIEIDGYTDNDGNDAANLALSQARADAVRNRLVALGIVAARLNTHGFGASKPIINNNTAENKAENRRVEFIRL